MSNASQPIVQIRGLTKSFGPHVVLNGIDFDIQPAMALSRPKAAPWIFAAIAS
jgi:ABC-type transporter Mla maintaining outer membrane lipid asymmetry ATPase subunit MlaF